MSADKRRKPRHRCNIAVEIRTSKWACRAYVVDLSETGVCVMIDRVADIWANQDIEMRCDELGYLIGITRWRRGNRIGIEFNSSTDTKAKIDAYQKYFRQQAAVA